MEINNIENINSFSNPAYLKKVFHETELDYISSHENKLIAAGVLWSCKEAVYKLCFKSSPKAFSFAPKQFLVTVKSILQNSNLYSVLFKNKRYSVIVEISEEYIHTFCFDKSELGDNNYYFDSDVRYDMSANQQNCSQKCREFIKQNLTNKYPYINIVEKEINGINLPALYFNNNREKSADISISHDGNYLAYTFVFFANFNNLL